ncbi:MAG: DUF6492 family protein [Solirubrobacteraceae bacterium]
MYLLTAEWAGLLARHHLWADDSEAAAHLHVDPARSVWYARSATRERVARLFAEDDDPGLFAVVQSNTGFPASQVASIAAEHIPIRTTTPIDVPKPPRRAKVYEWLCVVLRLGATQVYRIERGRRRPRMALAAGGPAPARGPRRTPRPGEERTGG